MALAVTATSACLSSTGGTVVQCASVQPRAGEDAKALAQRLADEIHARAFAPRIDLSQTDVRSLDGSTGVGDARSSDKARSVLDELRGGRPKDRSLDIELNEN